MLNNTNSIATKTDYVRDKEEFKIKVKGREFYYKAKKSNLNKRSETIQVYNIEILFVLDHTIWE